MMDAKDCVEAWSASGCRGGLASPLCLAEVPASLELNTRGVPL